MRLPDGTSGGVVRALRFVDGEPVGAPFDIAANPGLLEPQIASSGDHYLVVVGERTAAPCGPTRATSCAKGILGARVSPSGQLLDASPSELITAPADTPMAIELGKIGFDGAHYVLPYTLWNQCAHHCESAVFVTRVSVDGVVLDEDAPRSTMLVDASRERQQTLSAVAATAGGVTVAWSGVPRDRFSGIATELSVEEREHLAVCLLAPGLSSPQTIFSAQGLPAGAILDASSGVLHWTPAPHEAGIHAGVRLIADDGSNHLEETLSITASNVASSISGTVRLSDGTPVAGVAVALQGRGYKRTTASELDGSSAFFDLVPQSYKLALGRASRRNRRGREHARAFGVRITVPWRREKKNQLSVGAARANVRQGFPGAAPMP